MLDNATIDALAHAYHTAENERRRTRAPGVLHPGFTTEDTYAVQRASAINEPDYGSLMADMFYDTGSEIQMSRFIQPRLESELGFVMGKRLKSPNCTIFDVLSAVDYVIPSAEINDGRT